MNEIRPPRGRFAVRQAKCASCACAKWSLAWRGMLAIAAIVLFTGWQAPAAPAPVEPGRTNAKLLLSLLGIVLLGITLMVIVLAAGRIARRAVRRRAPARQIGQDLWYAKPLNAPLDVGDKLADDEP